MDDMDQLLLSLINIVEKHILSSKMSLIQFQKYLSSSRDKDENLPRIFEKTVWFKTYFILV